MEKIDWKTVVCDPLYEQYREGELEIDDRKKTYRGPLTKIVIHNESLIFFFLWSADLNTNANIWQVARNKTAAILPITTLVEKGVDSCLVLTTPEILIGKIYPKGGSRLDPKDVVGLDLNNLPLPVRIELDE